MGERGRSRRGKRREEEQEEQEDGEILKYLTLGRTSQNYNLAPYEINTSSLPVGSQAPVRWSGPGLR